MTRLSGSVPPSATGSRQEHNLKISATTSVGSCHRRPQHFDAPPRLLRSKFQRLPIKFH